MGAFSTAAVVSEQNGLSLGVLLFIRAAFLEKVPGPLISQLVKQSAKVQGL